MTKRQFRALYREFLFRLVDLELLSPDAHGDINKLLGQFAAVLTLCSVGLGLGGLLFDHRGMPPALFAVVSLGIEHFLISTTMLVVGLFAVLSWDSTFPDRRDVLVLAPLPVRARTFFLAKVAAVATGLAVAVVVLNAGPGLTWPLTLSTDNPSFLDMMLPFARRTFLAYWGTMLAAGAFLFCSVLSLQGLAALLPRRIFLRLSAWMQMSAFALFVAVYFLQPALLTPAALTAPGNQTALAILPTYWFLGFFQQLNGTLTAATAPLAHRAWIGLGVATTLTAAAYGRSYFRTLRKVVEEPDIAPGIRGLNKLPRFGTQFETAVVQFGIRALARSRQHRVVLAFYMGVALAITIGFLKDPQVQRDLSRDVNAPLLMSSVVLLSFWVLSTRLIFAIPVNPRANWIFRVTPVRGGAACLTAVRRALWLLAWTPSLIASAAVFFYLWSWRAALGHLFLLGLLAAILIELSLYRFQKIPFTCSWLPGKAFGRLMFVGVAFALHRVVFEGTKLERRALDDFVLYGKIVAVLAIVLAAARWRTAAAANSEEPIVQFEEHEEPVITGLGLFRDGVLPGVSK
ncbi:MAG TPA: hypothetical protein VG297_12745 [Bryobacteraceae bacterium]|nr:hypothetical protein [Bryobacteraceae bacterium]